MKKPDFSSLWKRRKKPILITAAVVLALSLGCGVWYYLGHNSSDPVYVYPFHYLGMTEYWGDSQESYGPVTTDKIQTVFLTDTQTVTEILVTEGQQVKKGDLLMTFDTTLSDLALERKRLEVEKLKLQLQDARAQLVRINSMKPMVIPEFTEEEEADDESLGRHISDAGYEISLDKDYDGASPERALICWIRDDLTIGNDIFQILHQTAREYQTMNLPPETEPPEEWEEPEETDPGIPEETEPEVPGETDPGIPEETEPEVPGETDPAQTGAEPSSASAVDLVDVSRFYVVFRITDSNRLLGGKTLWQGMEVSTSSGGYRFRFTEAAIPDHMVAGEDTYYDEGPQIDYGSGYTAAQIAQMRSEQEKKIKDLEFQIKMAETNYKIALTEASDGNVYAQIDGTVVSLLTEEEAKESRQPVLKVSGGGGFYIEGSVSELEKENLLPGQEVTVNDWNTGNVYTGTVDSIGDFPSTGGYWSGMGNPNTSYYPFRVFVDGSADLQSGQYASITYSTSGSQTGIYLENPFLRTENGRSYVLVLGQDGRLEQRFVVTGKSLWGSYTQILEGITSEDLIAFPYGKNVRPGVRAVEGDMSNLYG